MTTVQTDTDTNTEKQTDPESGRDAELKALAEQAGRDLEDASALEILQWAVDTFGKQFCVTSSMEDAVVAHLASRARPGVDVVFLDTGYHFEETIGTRDAVEAVMDVNVITLTPRQTVAEQDAEYGPKLHDRNPDLCCALRKVKPSKKGSPSTAPGRRACAATSPRPGRTPRSSAGTRSAARSRSRRSPAGRRTTSTRTSPSTAYSPTPADGRLRVRRLRPLHPPGA